MGSNSDRNIRLQLMGHGNVPDGYSNDALAGKFKWKKQLTFNFKNCKVPQTHGFGELTGLNEDFWTFEPFLSPAIFKGVGQ